MDNNNESTPATSGSQTPTVPVGAGWGPMGGGYYNMYPWQQMMPGMAGGQAMPAWGAMPQMTPQLMQQIMQMMSGPQAGVQPGVHATPGVQATPGGDNVYRPSLDFLTASSHTSTPVETQFTGNETFSLEELGIDMDEEDTPVQTGGVGRGQAAPQKKKSKGKGKVVGESSQPATRTRRKWTDDENVALAKAWVSVCDDPLVSNNQKVTNMWGRIAAAYKRNCPHGKAYTGEECRKGWDRIRAAVSRFTGLYTNALRMQTSGQTEEDCRRIAEKAFPVPNVYKDFTYWNSYLVLKDSEKFRAGVDAGWPKKQRLNRAGDYSSSGGSHSVPDDVQEFPSPPSFSRRTRPVGQRRAQRAARGVHLSPQEVQSASPPVQSASAPVELGFFSRIQTRSQMYKIFQEWRATTDPVEKSYLQTILDSMRVDLTAAAAQLEGSVAGSDAANLEVTGSGDNGGDGDSDGDDE